MLKTPKKSGKDFLGFENCSIFALPNRGVLFYWPIRLVVRTQGFHP